MKILDRLRQAILMLSEAGARAEQGRTIRNTVLLAAAAARKPGQLTSAISGIEETAAFHAAETSTWLTTEQIREGASGPFDSCDLTAWLALAEKASVPFVPARPILHLSEEEADAASGTVGLPETPAMKRALGHVREALAEEGYDMSESLSDAIDHEALVEKLYAAMDDVPEGWMVRTSACGGSELKALAGVGLASDGAPEVRFGPGLEVGPGWIREGNRRRVNAADKRTVEIHASGSHCGMLFLARPWQQASRYVVCDDPHRHGSPFQGPGRWPMEWRAFVRKGRVTGVSIYYTWTGAVTAENAAMAMRVREIAQKIVDVANAQGLKPRLMAVEHARRRPEFAAVLEHEGFGRGDFHCTLDFIETDTGPMLLEGGPGNTPFGGGHPCGFAGAGGPPAIGRRAECEGVAFRPMAHILIAEPQTWRDGDRAGAILPWEEVARLAEKHLEEKRL